ncbi:MAG TPA: hypothetical protein VK978_01830 [Candidatus Saccharimonadales bacterium]|nr:hypothetical protein [Candidatus Saccharimonadales bacterium]
MTHNNHPAPQEHKGSLSDDQRAGLARALGSLGTFGDRMAAADRQNAIGHTEAVPRTSLQETLRDPSTKVVQWNANEQGPTVTVRVDKSGAVLPADILRGSTLILTNEKGVRIATNFIDAVKLPPVDATSGKFVRSPGEPLDAKNVATSPAVGNDVIIGEAFGNGPRIVQATIEGDVFALGRNDLGRGLHFDKPDVQINAPDPTLAASDFLDEVRRS